MVKKGLLLIVGLAMLALVGAALGARRPSGSGNCTPLEPAGGWISCREALKAVPYMDTADVVATLDWYTMHEGEKPRRVWDFHRIIRNFRFVASAIDGPSSPGPLPCTDVRQESLVDASTGLFLV